MEAAEVHADAVAAVTPASPAVAVMHDVPDPTHQQQQHHQQYQQQQHAIEQHAMAAAVAEVPVAIGRVIMDPIPEAHDEWSRALRRHMEVVESAYKGTSLYTDVVIRALTEHGVEPFDDDGGYKAVPDRHYKKVRSDDNTTSMCVRFPYEVELLQTHRSDDAVSPDPNIAYVFLGYRSDSERKYRAQRTIVYVHPDVRLYFIAHGDQGKLDTNEPTRAERMADERTAADMEAAVVDARPEKRPTCTVL